jgi:hypothetical protein
VFITGFAAVALNADSTAPKPAKILSEPIHLRKLVKPSLDFNGRLAKSQIHHAFLAI